MSKADLDRATGTADNGAIGLYCMGTLMIEEAARSGCHAFAKSMESVLETLLLGMPRDQQSEALQMSYAIAVGGEQPEKPRLRLVFSRD